MFKLKIRKIVRIYQTCFKLSKFLDNGLYFYKNGIVSRSRSLFPVFIFSIKKLASYNFFKIKLGIFSNKTIVEFNNSFCYLYGNKKKFTKIISNNKLFNYEKMNIYNIDYKRKLFFSNKVFGIFGLNASYFSNKLIAYSKSPLFN